MSALLPRLASFVHDSGRSAVRLYFAPVHSFLLLGKAQNLDAQAYIAVLLTSIAFCCFLFGLVAAFLLRPTATLFSVLGTCLAVFYLFTLYTNTRHLAAISHTYDTDGGENTKYRWIPFIVAHASFVAFLGLGIAWPPLFIVSYIFWSIFQLVIIIWRLLRARLELPRLELPKTWIAQVFGFRFVLFLTSGLYVVGRLSLDVWMIICLALELCKMFTGRLTIGRQKAEDLAVAAPNKSVTADVFGRR